jgi:hypothetical protein
MAHQASRVKGEGRSADDYYVVHQHIHVKELVPTSYKSTHAFESARDNTCTKRLDCIIRSETSFETPVTERTVPFTVHPKTEVLMQQHV